MYPCRRRESSSWVNLRAFFCGNWLLEPDGSEGLVCGRPKCQVGEAEAEAEELALGWRADDRVDGGGDVEGIAPAGQVDADEFVVLVNAERR